ncbi:MAG: C39 family peptidase [Burkholderiales bacterium]|nr:C39 family peptidase [Burkholderiales bacterium]
MRSVAIACACCAMLLGSPDARPSGSTVFAGTAAGTFSMPVRTLRDMRLERAFRTTVRQQYDFSCGSAAVATLLTHHYGRRLSEADVFRAMFEQGDQARIRREGFSLLDMKRYLESLGYEADGFEAGLDQLAEANVPAIVLIRENGYNHFVVLKGLADGQLVVGDPSVGTRFMSRDHFESVWQGGILFVIRSHLDVAQFNTARDWRSRLIAPLGEAIDRNALGAMVLTLPPPDAF